MQRRAERRCAGLECCVVIKRVVVLIFSVIGYFGFESSNPVVSVLCGFVAVIAALLVVVGLVHG